MTLETFAPMGDDPYAAGVREILEC
jgi:hypothetical protein